MTSFAAPAGQNWVTRLPFYYGWVMVVLSAVAMTATLPGRTHGLGLITEDLIRDLSLERTTYSRINLWTSLLGAGFCIPIGRWIDRRGVRTVFPPVVLGLGLAVWLLSRAIGPWSLAVALVLIRGFGQSSLSVVSMAMIGKWFGRRAGLAMGVFSVLMGIGFGGSIEGMGAAILKSGWRDAWFGLALGLFAFIPIGWLFIRSTPESIGVAADSSLRESPAVPARVVPGYTLRQALARPAFWTFVLATSAFNLVWSALMLFNQSILDEIGFGRKVAADMLVIFGAVGLAANLVCGAFAKRERLGFLLGLSLTILAGALAAFPHVSTLNQLRAYSAATGVTSGIIMVVFFSVWGQVFGRAHVAHIQGAAQVISVIGSAIGPDLLAHSHARMGSYLPMFSTLAAAMGVLAACAYLVPIPPEPTGDAEELAEVPLPTADLAAAPFLQPTVQES